MSMVRVAAAVLGLGLLLAPLGSTPAVAQCSMCQSVVNGSAEGRAMGAELNQAILVMFGAPYLVFGAFVTVALRQRIRERLRGPALRWRLPSFSRLLCLGRSTTPPQRPPTAGSPF
jgi:hydrogenase/urease accessory protein HupE